MLVFAIIPFKAPPAVEVLALLYILGYGMLEHERFWHLSFLFNLLKEVFNATSTILLTLVLGGLLTFVLRGLLVVLWLVLREGKVLVSHIIQKLSHSLSQMVAI